jgi:hypothetical protein
MKETIEETPIIRKSLAWWGLFSLAVTLVLLLAVTITLIFSIGRDGEEGKVKNGPRLETRGENFDQHFSATKENVVLHEEAIKLSESYKNGVGVLKDFQLADEAREKAVKFGEKAAFELRLAAAAARTSAQIQAVLGLCRSDPRLSDDRLLGRCFLKASILGDPDASDRLAEIGKRATNAFSQEIGVPAPFLKRVSTEPGYPFYVYGLLNVCAAKTHSQKCGEYRDEIARVWVLNELSAQAFSRQLMEDVLAELE